MPISSGANRWPKSYWTKPQPPEIPLKLIKVAERPSIECPDARVVSLPSSVDGTSKMDNGFQSEPSSLDPVETNDEGPSDAYLEPPAMRSPAVVVPLSVEKLTTKKQDTEDTNSNLPIRPIKRSGCTTSVSTTLSGHLICFV